MKLLGISGSLRAQSSNTRLLQAAALCAPEGISIQIADCLGDLPHFNPDLDVMDHEPLSRWIDLVRCSDGLIVSSPEYARGYPGTLKNAFDWLVQTDAHIDKPFMLLGASDRSTVARDSLTTVLMTMSGLHIEAASIIVPLMGNDDMPSEIVGDAGIKNLLSGSLSTFVTSILSLSSPE